jgi:hypothetical protein
MFYLSPHRARNQCLEHSPFSLAQILVKYYHNMGDYSSNILLRECHDRR